VPGEEVRLADLRRACGENSAFKNQRPRGKRGLLRLKKHGSARILKAADMLGVVRRGDPESGMTKAKTPTIKPGDTEHQLSRYICDRTFLSFSRSYLCVFYETPQFVNDLNFQLWPMTSTRAPLTTRGRAHRGEGR